MAVGMASKATLLVCLLAASSNALPGNYKQVTRHRCDQNSIQKAIQDQQCICLQGNTQSKDSTGKVVEGQYSYLDPLGSLITVTYTVGVDGHYEETRKVQKNFGRVSTEKVVTDVLDDLQGQVLTVIETVVSSAGPDASTHTVVTRIVSRLRTTITRAVRESLRAHRGPAGNIDETRVAVIVDQVVAELTPFIAARVAEQRKEVTTTTVTTTSTNPDELVATIIVKLKVLIEQIISDTYAGRPVATTVVTSSNDIVSRILAQLRPAIVTTVREHILHTRKPVVVKEEFSVDLITDLVTQLQSTIRTTVTDVISGYPATTDTAVLVDEIVLRLQPTVRSVISATVTRRGLNYSAQKINRLNQRVVEGLRPIVRQTIEAYRQQQVVTQETLISSQSFVTAVTDELQPAVDSTVGRVVSSASFKSVSQQVSQVVQSLRPAIRRAVARVLVRNNIYVNDETFYNSATYKNLVTRIVADIREAITAAIRQHHQNLLVQQEQQVLEVTFVSGVTRDLEAEVATLVKEVISITADDSNDDYVISQVLARLRPIIRTIVEQNLARSNIQVNVHTFYTSATYQTLVETVLERVRAVVVEAVRRVRSAQLEQSVLSNNFINLVADRLRPYIVSSVRTEAALSGDDDTVVRRVLSSAVSPNVERAVRDSIAASADVNFVTNSFYTSSLYAVLVERVTDDARIIAHQELAVVRNAARARSGRIVAEVFALVEPEVSTTVRNAILSDSSRSDVEIVNAVSSQLRLVVVDLVTARATAGVSVSSLVDQVMSRLSPVINGYVVDLRVDLVDESRAALVQTISVRVSPTVRALAKTVVSRSYPAGATVDQMVQEVITLLRPAVYRFIESNAASHSWLSTQSARDNLFALIVQQLESVIYAEVQSFVSSYTTTTTTVVTEQKDEIRSIFGVGGANSVRVNTPTHQYAYEHDRK